MKAVPKVNTDGLYLEDTLVDDAFSGVVPFYANPPAPDPAQPPETDTEADEQPEEEPQPAGYIVGIPVPPGLYLPRFDLSAWEAYQDDLAAAQVAYQTAYEEWASQPEEERGEPPTYIAPEQPELWIEGMTQEEIEALNPPAEPTEMDLLQAAVQDLRSQNEQLQEMMEGTGEELAQMKTAGAEQKQIVDMVGAEQVKQDLTTLDLKQQNSVIGAELVKKDISILDLYMQNQVLGQMLAALELKILAKGTGGEENV